VVVMMLWLSGKFSPKVPQAAATLPSSNQKIDKSRAVAARLITMPLTESAVGTIRAVHETTISSKLLSRVTALDLKAGQKVRQGDVLVQLDDGDLRARLQQARATVASAEAVRNQAAVDEQRVSSMLKTFVASRQEYDKAATALKSADAELNRAREAVNEVQSLLDYATVRSPLDGTVVDKRVDVGDTVMPGQVLATLYDPKRMQLVASVRESLAYRLQVGQPIGVQVDVLHKLCSGTVSEIVPEAQSASRTFQVKVTGPCPPGIYSGMFGRIVIPLDDEKILVIPARAVRNVGQLEMVDVLEEGQAQRRAIRTGRHIDDSVEVLSGLKEGEKVLNHSVSAATQEAGRD
jgi:membrane fusion protein (multidrug efflux system)